LAVYIIYSGEIVLQCNAVGDLIVVVVGEEGFLVILEGAVFKRLADAVDSIDDEVLVMNAGENLGGDFVGLKKMVEIGARVIFTTFAVTVGHEGSKVVGKFGVFDINATIFCIE
jgi:hypothetical protein